MATIASNLPSGERETFGSDLAGVFSFFMDPVGAARRVDRKWFWIAPVVILSIAAAIYTAVQGPIVARFLETSPLPANVTPEQYQTQMRISGMIYKILPFLMPLFIIIGDLIWAGLLLATSSMLAVRARFSQLFNLVAGCGIISTLQMVAWAIILTAKHDISSTTDLKPALGFDILLPQGTNKFVLAIFSFFSIFQIWWLVMAILVYSVAFRTSKGKAAGAVLPPTLVFLIFTLVGAIFQKT